jgi:predicted nucleotidyltransferase
MITTLFKCIVGSQAHGLATPESDFDYRGVFITPTVEFLSLGSNPKQTAWTEGAIDDTSWELGHFLHLATKCNPTILEVFLSPLHEVQKTADGKGSDYSDTHELRALFPYVWNSKYVMDAFIGYSHNQRKKLLEGKDGRPHKYAAAYLRVMYQAKELLQTGTFTIRIADTDIGPYIRAVKNQDTNAGYDISIGAVINRCQLLEQEVREAYAANPNKETDYGKVNDFLLKMRMKYWNADETPAHLK